MIAHKTLDDSSAHSTINHYIHPLTQKESDRWEHGNSRISVSTLNTNMDKAQKRMKFLMQDSIFRQAYESLSPDMQSYVSLVLIAHEDLRTLDEIDAYNRLMGE